MATNFNRNFAPFAAERTSNFQKISSFPKKNHLVFPRPVESRREIMKPWAYVVVQKYQDTHRGRTKSTARTIWGCSFLFRLQNEWTFGFWDRRTFHVFEAGAALRAGDDAGCAGFGYVFWKWGGQKGAQKNEKMAPNWPQNAPQWPRIQHRAAERSDAEYLAIAGYSGANLALFSDLFARLFDHPTFKKHSPGFGRVEYLVSFLYQHSGNKTIWPDL